MPQVDTNIENYTVSELLTILDLDNPDAEQITKKTNEYIEKFTKEKNPDMVNFFRDMKTELLNYAEELYNEEEPITAELGPAREQSNNWYENENLKQKDPIQKNKITQQGCINVK
jgi:hypothetical protein